MELTPTRNTRLAFENLISSLTAKPKKVIFLGERSQMNKVMPDYEKSENSFLNRAKEMGITFIANATEMTPTQWKNVFKNMA